MRYLMALFIFLLSVGVLAASTPLPALPFAISNNAVALLESDGQAVLYSFGGLGSGKTYRDVSPSAFEIDFRSGKANVLPALPDGRGRLASIAVSVGRLIYIFGGYTVAKDGAERSTEQVFVFDPATKTYKHGASIPLPVDDSVAFVYKRRYIYLISGWSQDRNVSDVQVYDTLKDSWSRATDYPGTPVFGHAGGLVGDNFIVMGGVKAQRQPNGRNQYSASDEAWYGEINPKDHLKIRWHSVHAPPVFSRYRIAATGSARLQAVIFVGGTNRPYNYNGMGYDKKPSEASREVFAFDMLKGQWRVYPKRAFGSMDHRGLIEWKGAFFTVGGMDERREVLNQIIRVDVP